MGLVPSMLTVGVAVKVTPLVRTSGAAVVLGELAPRLKLSAAPLALKVSDFAVHWALEPV